MRHIARVRTRAQFAALRSTGRRSRRRDLQLTFVPAAPGDDAPPAVAFAIGKAVGTAVVRNRLRRRLRALVADVAPPAGTYLVVVSPAAAALDFAGLREQLTACLDEVTTAAATDVRSGSS